MILKRDNIKEKINELNLLLINLESHEVKFNIVYNLSNDLVITITDKTSQRTLKETTKKTKKESE